MKARKWPRLRWRASQGIQRLGTAFLLAGQVTYHLLRGRIPLRNSIEQMALVGPASLSVALITAAFVGMVFTIQVAREFITFGATSAVGGVLAIALARELGPVLTAVVLAGRVGSAFAAEIGTMKVTEQIDALYMLGTDPVDYLVVPRFIACVLMLPILNILALVTGLWGGLVIADYLYGIPRGVYIESIQNFLQTWDLWSSIIKSGIFGGVVAIIGCNWGITTTGGAKGVGQSTTAAVVISLLAIFILNFFLSWALFGGSSSLVPTF
ncbi:MULTISPECIES: MlaE family lipid ABC transporter permease subunit [unclassified Thermosynechococcus]|uniref:MlaE family lipid ABC transporter permease subunit n=1 Tax=unclassified Thermosynechococcus TaxID=2622553 RepID=UPI001981500B|nr:MULTISPECIES: MlaE family lipid ABC transporter permease subunit [unclassified Thermosynechococcus]MDR5638674.1 MlaE family lipid ABC transporter permease subunit [Thermosynechococcus sp. PP42]MDR7899060.1 MlaE family lipid ABC transporter permease subunit [Thermosynechococcus sp. JY1332]MDR7906466.1 MlaE family lipid ABC transporter permease subunit [Thermosynechococcus sp. JY1334]MDR7921491.1 MlaE family lipid ABC transporter permease subunit [Thermosynechococcus sp. HY213]MDR7994284.1 Ml